MNTLLLLIFLAFTPPEKPVYNPGWEIGRFYVIQEDATKYRAYTGGKVSGLHNTAYKAINEIK